VLDLPLPASHLAIAIAISAAAAAVQGTIGFGYAIVAVPLLSLLDPRLAPVPQILTSVPLTVLAAWRERGHVDLASVGWILLGRIPGLLLGVWLVTVASTRTLDLLIGGFVLLAVLLLSTRVRVRRTRAVDFGAGSLSMIMGYTTAIGGPPLALLYQDARGATIRSTLGVLFAVGVTLSAGTRAATGQITRLDVTLGIVLLVPVLLGLWGSRLLHDRIEGPPLRLAVLLLSGAASAGLLVRAWLGP